MEYEIPIINFDAMRTHLFFLNLVNEKRGDISKWEYDDWYAVIHSTGTPDQYSRFYGAHCHYDGNGSIVMDTSQIIYS